MVVLHLPVKQRLFSPPHWIKNKFDPPQPNQNKTATIQKATAATQWSTSSRRRRQSSNHNAILSLSLTHKCGHRFLVSLTKHDRTLKRHVGDNGWRLEWIRTKYKKIKNKENSKCKAPLANSSFCIKENFQAIIPFPCFATFLLFLHFMLWFLVRKWVT